MKAMVVLVGVEYGENLGLIARVMKNFGLSDLYLVKPKAMKSSGKSRSRAMHAKDVLLKAKICPSLPGALEKADYSIATTAVSSKSPGKGRKALTPKALAKKFRNTSAKLALVFGRESSGLSNSEIGRCDFIVTIPTSAKYRTLNISHACAVLLYELFGEGSGKGTMFNAASRRTKEIVVEKFRELAAANPEIRDRKGVSDSFRRVVSRAPATEKELNSITGVLSGSLKKIKKGTHHQ